jgi:L-serine kinase (ADP)
MSRPPRYARLPPSILLEHEEVDPQAVRALTETIRADGIVRDPIWVADGSHVILNGHHRFHALVLLGAIAIPAWLFDYDDPMVRLERWYPGPPLQKADVVARARSGVPFPPKTTKHTIERPLPARPTPLAELLAPAGGTAPPTARARRQPRRSPG